jgi:DNA-binding transcriptional ArsR family regulator
MVKSAQSTIQLDRTFAALADPTRRAIIERLAFGETTVSELAKPFRMSLPAVSKHLSVLEGAGLVKRERSGRVRNCTLVAAPMKDAAEWVERYSVFWEERLDALGHFLEQSKSRKQPRKKG